MKPHWPKRVIGAAVFLFAGLGIAASAAPPPALLPPGWTTRPIPGERNIIQYVSPDRRALLTLRDISARTTGLSAAMRAAAARPDETVTYQQRGRDWFVVSGYRGDQIFYRRVNLACGGKRWHLIELNYPRSDKRQMDATVTMVSHRLQQFNNVCPSRREPRPE